MQENSCFKKSFMFFEQKRALDVVWYLCVKIFVNLVFKRHCQKNLQWRVGIYIGTMCQIGTLFEILTSRYLQIFKVKKNSTGWFVISVKNHLNHPRGLFKKIFLNNNIFLSEKLGFFKKNLGVFWKKYFRFRTYF